jgi:DNA-binding transcriptional MerR regulator/methylmalonyl-CoA mutase cobalamin-binding subunit
MVSTTPAFNIKVVLKETGLSADALRAWERRYGLPVPQRTAGGHRLYSQRDIETIKWLMKRQQEGLSISRAVDMWKEQIASGLDPLAGSAQPAVASTSMISAQYQSATTLDESRTHWIEACLNFSESTAEQILNQAFSMFPVEAVCIEILQKGLSEIGTLWYENRASVHQEHFASSLAARRLDALLSAAPAPTRKQTVIVGCPPEDWHALIPLLLALFLRRRGLNVIYLGANVPAEQFSNTIKNVGADLVVMVAQQLITAATLQQAALMLASHNIPVAFGGRIFGVHPDLVESIPGHYLGDILATSVENIELLLNEKVKRQPSKAASPIYVATHDAYISKRTQIELTFKELLKPLSISPEAIRTGIYFLGENISAALQLGDLSHVSVEIDWLKGLLQAHESSEDQLIHFMQTYSQAVNQNINGQGQPIYEWLASEVEKLKRSSES